jgi:bacteriocin biosynthesis cyclodehydratase domain-containing protein
MDIRLDPRLPLVWRDPHTLQIGVDRPVAVLGALTSRHERIISAIASGHGRSGVGAVAQRAGCREGEVAELATRLSAGLVQQQRPKSEVSIHVAGSSSLADEIRSLLVSAGVVVAGVDVDEAAVAPPPTLGVAVSDHVHDPVLAGVWLRRDVPHLCVVTSDLSSRIGPLVVPGEVACAHCLDLHRADVDSAWGVIAGQLWGRPVVGRTLLSIREVAVRAVRRALARAEGDPDRLPDAVIEMIDSETGAITRSTSRPHPGCGCAALPRSDSAADPAALAPAPGGSTRGADVAVPA